MNLDTGKKILASFAVALALLLAVAGAGYRGVTQLEAEVVMQADQNIPTLGALAAFDEAHVAVPRFLNALAIGRVSDPELRAGIWNRHDEARVRLDAAWKAFGEVKVPADLAPLREATGEPYRAFDRALVVTASSQRTLDRLRAEGADQDGLEWQAAEEAWWKGWNELRVSSAALDQAVEKFRHQAIEDVAADKAQALVTVSTARSFLLGGVAAGVALLLAAGWWLARNVRSSLARLAAEARRLAAAVGRGELSTRADEAAVAPEFRPILAGMNGTMEAFVAPLRRTAESMDRISRGDVPPPIADRYEGEFEATKEAVNRSIAAVSALVADANTLAGAAREGRLAVRADATRHQGEFRAIVDGLNRTLETVVAPLSEVTATLEQLAARDLRTRIESDHPGDYAKLKQAFNATAEALHDALAHAADSAGQVSAASNEIAGASQSVANGASEQAAALEETSSQLESMTSMTRQSADNAQQANTLARSAREAAEQGATAMEQMAGAMGRIKASAEGTSQIIRDINEIAFQTNLLALNAAVEAARAGDAGRGFAVVAEEVRALALRSKDAAQKTEELIRESVRETEAGVGTARDVQDKLQQIQGSVAKVTDIVAEIAASAKEQSAGIDQVSRAVSEMDKVTQQNAANSEQSSSAAAELSGQAAELASIVAAFRLHSSARAAAPAKTPPPPAPARSPTTTAPAVPLPAPARPAPSSKANGTRRPQDVIPFDDDTAFQQF